MVGRRDDGLPATEAEAIYISLTKQFQLIRSHLPSVICLLVLARSGLASP